MQISSPSNLEEINLYLRDLEKQFSPKNWIVNDIHLWPLLRFEIFFFFFYRLAHTSSKVGHTRPKQTNTRKNPFLVKVKGKFNVLSKIFYYVKVRNSLSRVHYLFLSAPQYRELLDGQNFDKFIDPLLERKELRQKSLVLDAYGIQKDYKNYSRVVHLEKAFLGFTFFRERFQKQKHTTKTYNFDLLPSSFGSFVTSISGTDLGKIHFRENVQARITLQLKKIEAGLDFYSEIFAKANVKKLFTVCYYNTDLTKAAIIGANRAGILNIDLQHGGIGPGHVAYGDWSHMGSEGYDVLPKEFWCWDHSSAAIINAWAQNHTSVKALEVGHPFLSYWKEKGAQVGKDQTYVLYSLQPLPLSFGDLFSSEILHLIESSPYKWYIRLHPRQEFSTETLITFFKEQGLYSKVNIIDANAQPLPSVLLNCLFHVTHSSGCTLEAAMLQKMTVVFTDIGKNYFERLIAEGKVLFIDKTRSDFEQSFTKNLVSLVKNTQGKAEETTLADLQNRILL